MEPGKYLAKVIDHDIHQKQGGQPSVMVQFQLKDTDQKWIWYGSFSGGARPITVETLVRLGYKGKDGSDLVRFRGEGEQLAPMVLDTATEFELVMDNETYNGKTMLKIKYINLPGRDALKRGDAGVRAIVGGLNLAGDFAEAKAKAPAAPAPAKTVSEDEIPF